MKIFYVLSFFTCLAFRSYSQAAFSPASEGYYVIVGAFAIKENAAKLNASLQKKGMNSSFGYLTSRNIYYVYTLTNSDVSICLTEMRELRKKPEFWDAWVRFIKEDGSIQDNLSARIEEEPKPTEPKPVVAETAKKSPETPPVETAAVTTEPEPEPVTADQKIIIPDKITLGNTEIFLSLYSARTDKVADGKVQVVDAERGRVITEAQGNTYLILPDPKNKSGNMSLICDVFGYRKVQKEINFNNPLADTSFIEQMGTQIVAHFELVRYEKGDIRALYNIYFYNDAAVMMPESRYELNALEDMMKENLNYKIRLHGHTNGHYHGKIIRVGSDNNFFSVAKDAKTTIGSAKELSESRAEVIRDYLVSKGIDGSRVEIKAWGGKKPLYDKNGANAKKNIRVEVEVLTN
jgi:outer membrane protein OmpA-like peptidoglycan-associated protein